MNLRQFRPVGINHFQVMLEACRQDPGTPIPQTALEDDRLTEPVRPTVEVSPGIFQTRREASSYLSKVLSPLAEQYIADNAGLWTWLTLFYFDSVCPLRNGKRNIKNDYYYIYEPRNPRHFYRHLLFISWRVQSIARDHNRLFLDHSLSSLDKVTSEVMKRLYLTRIPCIFEVLDRIYWDKSRGKARAGITDSEIVKPGDLVHRLPIRIRQLEKTYDLHSLSADQLIVLLGDEFAFKQGKAKV